MSPVSRNKILSKLQRLQEYTSYLKLLKKIPKKDFISNYEHFGLAERFLQLSIECLLDISKLAAIELNLERANNNHELFEVLYKNKIITNKLFENLYGIAGFRNILVHDYEKIDRTIVYDYLQNKLKDFESFQKAVGKKLG